MTRTRLARERARGGTPGGPGGGDGASVVAGGSAGAPDLSVEAAYCDHCGRGLDETDHATCRARRELEPPRYCAACRRRLVVQVVPRGWSATCSRHGLLQ